MKITVISIIVLIAVFTIVLELVAQAETEEIKISTFYPSPNADFMNLEAGEGVIIEPHATASDYVQDLTCDANNEGLLVFGIINVFGSEAKYYYCDSSANWTELK